MRHVTLGKQFDKLLCEMIIDQLGVVIDIIKIIGLPLNKWVHIQHLNIC